MERSQTPVRVPAQSATGCLANVVLLAVLLSLGLGLARARGAGFLQAPPAHITR